MKKVYIVHGWDGGPEKDWVPWAKQELEKLGYEVHALAMPNPEHPRLDIWIPYLSQEIGEVDENTILIGHSMGCRTILGFLENLPGEQKADKVILVAGWVNLSPVARETDEEKEVYESWIKRSTDYEKVRSHANSFTAIFSDNDPYVPFEENSKTYKEKLDAKIVMIPNMGHFSEDAGITELPLLLELIK